MSKGFKDLSVENWLQPDPVMDVFVRISLLDGSVSDISANEWAEKFFVLNLNASVPDHVRNLYEVARGSIAYGVFFYPLFTLGCEQLFRVAETAAAAKCLSLNASHSKTNSFQHKLKWLLDNGVLSKQDYDEWDAMRQLRNQASHPKQQTILAPGTVLSLLQRIADKINQLFS